MPSKNTAPLHFTLPKTLYDHLIWICQKQGIQIRDAIERAIQFFGEKQPDLDWIEREPSKHGAPSSIGRVKVRLPIESIESVKGWTQNVMRYHNLEPKLSRFMAALMKAWLAFTPIGKLTPTPPKRKANPKRYIPKHVKKQGGSPLTQALRRGGPVVDLLIWRTPGIENKVPYQVLRDWYVAFKLQGCKFDFATVRRLADFYSGGDCPPYLEADYFAYCAIHRIDPSPYTIDEWSNR